MSARLPLVLMALTAALSWGAARAGDAVCAWGAISPSARADITSRYRKDGLAAASVYQLPTLDIQSLGDRCARPRGSLDAAKRALFLEARRDDLASQLRALGAGPSDADAEWIHALTPADRAVFMAYLEGIDAGRRPRPAETAIVDQLLDQPAIDVAIRGSGKAFETKATLLAYYAVLARVAAAESRF